MKKRTLRIALASGLACCSLLVIPLFNKVTAESHVKAESVTPPLQTVHYDMLLYKDYLDLKDLKKDAQYVVIANFVEKKPTVPDGGGGTLYRTENVFHVEKALKGDNKIENTNILVNEQGGIVGNTKYVMKGNELFEPGQYVLFLEKITDRSLIPYDIYVVQGVTSGKFKVKGDKIIGYGQDKVRQEAEKLSKKDLIDTVEKMD